jgi:Replication protein C C-terminal region
VIAAKRETIHSPGGYLRGMIGRAQKGELHLSNSLWGLAGASVPKEPTMRSAWRCIPTVAAAKAGYNRQSLAETATYRYKAVISRRLHARFCPINGTCSIG